MKSLLLLITLATCAGLIDSPAIYRWSALLIAFWLLIVLIALAWRITATAPPLLLTPLPVFLGFSAVTFGFGPMIHFFGPEAAISYLQSRWQLTEVDLFRVQVLNLVGLFFTFAGVVLAMNWTGLWQRRLVLGAAGLKRISDKQLLRGCLLFLAAALLLRGSDWLLDVDFLGMLPGFLAIISKTGWIAVVTAAVLAGRRGGAAWFLLVPLVLIETVAGALTLDTFDMLMPSLLVFVGLYVSGRGLAMLIVGAGIVVVVYTLVRPIVDAGRAEVWSLEKKPR